MAAGLDVLQPFLSSVLKFPSCRVLYKFRVLSTVYVNPFLAYKIIPLLDFGRFGRRHVSENALAAACVVVASLPQIERLPLRALLGRKGFAGADFALKSLKRPPPAIRRRDGAENCGGAYLKICITKSLQIR